MSCDQKYSINVDVEETIDRYSLKSVELSTALDLTLTHKATGSRESKRKSCADRSVFARRQ